MTIVDLMSELRRFTYDDLLAELPISRATAKTTIRRHVTAGTVKPLPFTLPVWRAGAARNIKVFEYTPKDISNE